jgi:hypothetical protein
MAKSRSCIRQPAFRSSIQGAFKKNGIRKIITTALEHFEKFLDLWKEAASGIAEFEDAKKRVAGLKSH